MSRWEQLKSGAELEGERRIFSAVNPTAGTGVATALAGTLSDTAGILQIHNSASSESSQFNKIVPLAIELTVTVAPASATAASFIFSTDTVDRYASGGAELTVANVNKDANLSGFVADVSLARVDFGALVLAAEAGSTEVDLGTRKARSVILVVGDVIRFEFGEVGSPSVDIAGTTAKRITIPVDPMVIYSGNSLVLRQLLPSNASTAASYEVNVKFYERT